MSIEITVTSDITAELLWTNFSDDIPVVAARTSTKGGGAETGAGKGLLNALVRDAHGVPFEHMAATWRITAPIFVWRQVVKHRAGVSMCLAGDTVVTFSSDRGLLRKKSIREFYDLWHNGTKGTLPCDSGNVRRYNEETGRWETAAVTNVVQSGVKSVIKVTTDSGRQLVCTREHRVLTENGWITAGELVVGNSCMMRAGGVVARATLVVGIEPAGEEMTYDLSVEGPWHNFLANGLIVHNSEESGRYRELEPNFYMPPPERPLAQVGKPMDYELVQAPQLEPIVASSVATACLTAWESYQRMLSSGVTREVARMVLPLNIMSTGIVTMNARALMHFLHLRTSDTGKSHPQWEIEMLATILEGSLMENAPVTARAFVEHGRVAP